MKFREATKEDKPVLRKMLRYAFSGTKNTYKDLEVEKPSKFAYEPKEYIVEEQGNIIATIGVIDFSQRIRGTLVRSAGMTAVACRPEYRRQEYMVKLFQYVFEKIYDEGFLVSTLYPFEFSFYEKLGYGQADSIRVYTVKSTDIIQRPILNRTISEDFDPDYSRCQPLYNKLLSQIDGLVERSSNVWKNLEGWNWTSGGFQFICQDEKGQDRGYLILRFEKKSPKNPFPYLEVREMVFFDLQTKQALLNFLANHDSQREFIKMAPFDTNYLPFFKNPRLKENIDVANSMFRIINAKQLLPLLKYPEDIDTQITLEIEDQMKQCSWNTKSFSLQISQGKGRFISEKAEKVKLGIKALSQIVAGFHTPHELAEVGAIMGSNSALDILNSIFPPKKFCHRDFY